MASGLNSFSQQFGRIYSTTSPRPISLSRAFSRYSENYPLPGDDSSLAEQVRQLASQVDQQSSAVSELASIVSGPGSAVENAGASLLGGSVLGGLASSAASGFSWQSIVKDILPFGGLISGIAGLFNSPATPAPLQQYDAPVPLNFSGILGANGAISQSSYNASGTARGSSPGLDLTDAEGGPQSAYARAADGSLKDTAGAAASRYSGVLDLSATVQNLVSATAPAPQTPSAASSADSTSTTAPTSPTPTATPQAVPGGVAQPQPAFDGPWFMDHAPYIAAAVRNAMLDYHPVVDVVNDL